MIEVTLTSDDLKMAEGVALKRNASQRGAGRADGKVMSDSLGIDKQGAEAELAVARALGLPWDGKFFEIDAWHDWRVDGHDVSGLEIRSTHHPKGSLILHPKDRDFSPFILVLTNKKPKYNIVGWAYGKEGKKEKWWRDVGYGRPCYYVPQNNLRKISELLGILKHTNTTRV